MNTEETIVFIIKLIICIGLILYVYFTLIKKLSNNYKVLVLPAITLINSIIFGYNAYKVADDITLIIWIIIFLTSLLLIVLVLRKIYLTKQIYPIINENSINENINGNKITNKSEINFHSQKKNISIEFSDKNFNQIEVVKQLEKENIISKNENNIKVFNAIINLEEIDYKIKWIDKSPTNSSLNNLKTLIYFLQLNYNLKGIDSTVVYKSIFLPYFDLNRKVSEKTFSQTYCIILQEFNNENNKSFNKISEILKID